MAKIYDARASQDKFIEGMDDEEKRGKIIERACLGAINKEKYQNRLKDELYAYFIRIRSKSLFAMLEDFLEKNPEKTPYDFLLLIKKEGPQGEEIADRVSFLTKKVVENKVVKNNHKFLNEIEVEQQLKIIEASQKDNSTPSEPENDFADDLHATIVEEMDIADCSDLEYYTAVGSHLDYSGIDAFFKYKFINKNGEDDFVRVCLDLTIDSPESKARKIKGKERAGGKYLADNIIYLDCDEIEFMIKIFKNRREKKEIKSKEFNEIRRKYDLLKNSTSKEIIKTIKKRINQKEEGRNEQNIKRAVL